MQPLPGEVADERLGLRIGQHPSNLLLEHGWLLQPSLSGDGQQLVIGNAAPEEEREPRRQIEIAQDDTGDPA